MTTPLRMTASVVLGSGQTATADTRKLSVPFREMCEIHEIDWTLTAALDNVNQAFDLGGLIRTKLSLGRIEVTRNRSNGFVPIWNLGVPVALTEATRDTSYTLAVCHYRWKLPVPLIIPRGMTLVSQFSRDVNTYLSGNITAVVSYAGRYLPTLARRPGVISVPFVSYYEVANTSAAAISDAQDLVNPFRVPVQVQRMVCRVRQTKTTGPNSYYWDALGHDTVDPPAGVTIQNSHGEAIVNNALATNLALVFPVQRRSWTFGQPLNPGERFIVRTSDNSGGRGAEDLMFSIIGHREERI